MVALPTSLTPTVDAIYKAYEDSQGSGYRDHLGASLIGGPCDRAKWYSWRWQTRAFHTGRLLRLFDSGNLAEARFVADLRKIGVTVLDVDPETGRQWTVRDASGHHGGSLDAIAIGFPEAPKTWHATEFKTHGIKSFNDLKKHGVEKSKPAHFFQMQTYMHLANLTRAFYLAVCKDSDELYQERIEYDVAVALRSLARAERIIQSVNPPPRISSDSAWHECRFCDHHASCHGTAMPERHCRSCLSATPIADGKWYCEKRNHELSSKMQRAGCEQHRYLTGLVHGQQVDAAPDASWVDYRMADGTVWRDGDGSTN